MLQVPTVITIAEDQVCFPRLHLVYGFFSHHITPEYKYGSGVAVLSYQNLKINSAGYELWAYYDNGLNRYGLRLESKKAFDNFIAEVKSKQYMTVRFFFKK